MDKSSEPKVMPREEVFRYIAELSSALLTDRPAPEITTSAGHMRQEDLIDATDAVLRKVSEQLGRVPDEFSGDPKVQEAIRYELDKVMSSSALHIRGLVASMPKHGD